MGGDEQEGRDAKLATMSVECGTCAYFIGKRPSRPTKSSSPPRQHGQGARRWGPMRGSRRAHIPSHGRVGSQHPADLGESLWGTAPMFWATHGFGVEVFVWLHKAVSHHRIIILTAAQLSIANSSERLSIASHLSSWGATTFGQKKSRWSFGPRRRMHLGSSHRFARSARFVSWGKSVARKQRLVGLLPTAGPTTGSWRIFRLLLIGHSLGRADGKRLYWSLTLRGAAPPLSCRKLSFDGLCASKIMAVF